MKIKLNITLKAKTDKLELSGDTLEINDVLYNLKKIPDYVEPENGERAPLPYKRDGFIHLSTINVGPEIHSDMSNGNLMRVHDLNNNGELELNELQKLIDFINLPEEERRVIRLKRMSDFIASRMPEEMRINAGLFFDAKYAGDQALTKCINLIRMKVGQTELDKFIDMYGKAELAWMNKGQE